MAIKDLKLKILEETHRMISEEGLENFSVRNLSSNLNVSHNALYRHFKSKADLLFTLLSFGFEHLTNQFHEIRKRTDIDEVQKFKECISIYFEFAMNNPNIYRIMFAFQTIGKEYPENLINSYRNIYMTLLEITRDCVKAGKTRKGSEFSILNSAWAFGHGVASLLIDNILPKSKNFDTFPTLLLDAPVEQDPDIHEVTKFSIDALFNSIFL